jgi:hypothetical protein
MITTGTFSGKPSTGCQLPDTANDAENFVLTENDELVPLQLDFQTCIFAKEDLVPCFHFEWEHGAVFEAPSGTNRHDLALLGFFFCCVRNDDAALLGFFGNALNQYSVMERSNLQLPYLPCSCDPKPLRLPTMYGMRGASYSHR